MSVTGNRSDSSSSSTPLFRELRKHASFFLKEKIKTARLALTDVTPAQLLTEEATSAYSPLAPDTKTMGMISRAAFEVDDYWRIVDILHKRLIRFDETNWRVSYKAVIILEHLLTHGPESVAQEFEIDTDLAIREMESFQYIDERGFNWGLTLRKKSQRMQKLLERGSLLKQERLRARTLSRGIQGFGSFSNSNNTSSSSSAAEETKEFGRSRSIFNHQDNNTSTSDNSSSSSSSSLVLELDKSPIIFKENNVMVPLPSPVGDLDPIIIKEEHPLLGDGGKYKSKEAVPLDHPFSHHDQHTTASLLSTGEDI